MIEMVNTQPGGETDLSKVFHEIVPRLQKRGMIFILSDCFTDSARTARLARAFPPRLA